MARFRAQLDELAQLVTVDGRDETAVASSTHEADSKLSELGFRRIGRWTTGNLVTWGATVVRDVITEAQRIELGQIEIGLGPWDRDDADDPGILEAIRDDIHMVVGVGHGEDVSWVTTDVIREYLTTRTE